MKNGVNGDIQSENGKEIRQRSRLKAYTNSKSMLLIDSGAYFTFSVGPLPPFRVLSSHSDEGAGQVFGGRSSSRPQAQQLWQKNLFVRAAGGGWGAEWPCGAPGGGSGERRWGPAGGREECRGAGRSAERSRPPLPALPLRSAPRPPTVPVPVAVPPAPAARSRRPLPGAGRPGCTMAGQEWDWFQREELIGHISDIRVQNLQGKQTPPRPLPRRPALLPPRLRFAPRLSSCSGIRSPPHGRREGEGGRRFPAAGVRGPAW